jgi:hypothetical protein
VVFSNSSRFCHSCRDASKINLFLMRRLSFSLNFKHGPESTDNISPQMWICFTRLGIFCIYMSSLHVDLFHLIRYFLHLYIQSALAVKFYSPTENSL